MEEHSGMIGFDYSNIESLKEAISTVESVVFNDISTHLNTLVGSIASFWYAQDAIDFETNFKTMAENKTEDINAAFQRFRDACGEELKNWISITGTTEVTDVDMGTSNGYSINVESGKIKSNNAGQVYIDLTSAKAFVETGINTEKTLLQGEISDAASEFTTKAFIGGGQVEAAQACFVKIGDVIDTIFEAVTKEMKNAIETTQEEYVTRADATLTNFSATDISNSGTSASV